MQLFSFFLGGAGGGGGRGDLQFICRCCRVQPFNPMDYWQIALSFKMVDNFPVPAVVGYLLYPPEASGGYFGLAFATPLPPPRVERFSALTL